MLIYLQTAALTLATIYACIVAYEASPRTWKHFFGIAVVALSLCAAIYQWPIWH